MKPDAHLDTVNAGRIGQPDSCADLLTPALLIDRPALQRNLERMAEAAQAYGVGLRPHVKTHKCSRIAAKQLDAGAVGVCCATLGEAEAMAAAGVRGLLITSPVGLRGKADWAADLAKRSDLTCTADSVSAVDELQAAAEVIGASIPVMVDVDLGSGRSGVISNHDALRVVERITDSAGLVYAGLQAYAGHMQHIPDVGERRRVSERGAAQLEGCLDKLDRVGCMPAVVTGSGTGCFAFDAPRGLYTECQVGSYLFMDREYHEIAQPDHAPRFETALFLSATVTSANQPDRVTIDAGQKALFRAGPRPRLIEPRDAGWYYECAGDEHGWLVKERESATNLPLGSRVELETPHCDPTVALHSIYHVVDGGMLVDLWPIDAREALPAR